MADLPNSIVEGCRAGDPVAERQLFERFESSVVRLARRMTGNQDVEDLAQQIFLRVFSTIRQFRGQAEFSTWVYRISVNECLQHRRKYRRRTEPLCEETPSPSPGPDHALEQADLVEKALGALDAPLRAAFVLREVEGLSYRQIASVLEIPEGTVASQLSRARLLLQDFVRRIETDH
jgi:RNA polymerase sigma-70 factor (ECF subfamily)